MDEFQFLRPFWLLAIIPLTLILIYVRRQKTQPSFWQDEIDPHLLPHVLVPVKKSRGQQPLWLVYALAGLIIILALAGPSWDQSPPVQLKPDSEPLVLILDLSPSMTVQDVHPNRLIAAQTKLHTLLSILPQRPTALVVFSSQAHSVMPLAEDLQLINDLIQYLTPELMPSQGSNSASGLNLAGNLLQQNNYTQGQLLLITDSADSYTIEAAKKQAENGYKTSVYAIGTAAGATLTVAKNSTSDASSQVHLALDKTNLLATAEAGQGIYQQFTQNEEDLRRLLNTFGKAWIAKSKTSLNEISDNQVKLPRDRGAVFILLLLPLALLMFRPGWLLVVCFAVVNIYPLPAAAMDWTAFWYNPAQRGIQALENDHPEQAEQLFSDPYLIGIAQYRQQKYAAALANFKQINTADAHYNRGNTLAHLGRYQEALSAYASAYQMDSSLKNAQKNARIVRQIIIDSEKSAEQSSKKPPKLHVSEKNKSEIKKQAALYAEDLLSTPDKQGIAPPSTEKKQQHEPLGKVSGGATLFSDRKTGKVDEGNTIGQTGSEGLDPADARDKIARQGKSAGEGKSAAKKTLPNKLLEKQNNTSASFSSQERSSREFSSQERASQEWSSRELSRQEQDEAKEAEQDQRGSVQPSEDTTTAKSDKNDSLYEKTQNTAESEPEPQNLQSRRIKERFQSLQHWLDSIDDNPSALLKEKFRREYRRGIPSASETARKEQPW
jgi:Ca-activated chloride channel family protein